MTLIFLVFVTLNRVFQLIEQCIIKIKINKGHLWPKNQNKCWYKTGSPPPLTSKKLVLKFLSVSTIVIPPANTGSESNSNIAVTNIAQPNNGNLCNFCPGALMFIIVVMKFIAPNIDEIPAKCKEKIIWIGNSFESPQQIRACASRRTYYLI